MNFRALLGSTDATAVPPKLINRLKSSNYNCLATGPDFCRPYKANVGGSIPPPQH
jgi:hypothetical protein